MIAIIWNLFINNKINIIGYYKFKKISVNINKKAL